MKFLLLLLSFNLIFAKVSIQFLGGVSGIISGSCFLLNVDGKKFLIDCGIFYGKYAGLNEKFGFKPENIEAVFLTHAHLDHSGRVPLLYRNGFDGFIYSTEPTRDICRVMFRMHTGIVGFESDRYIVSTKSRVYHRPGCKWIKHIKKKFRKVFYDKSDLKKYNYRPCLVCLRDDLDFVAEVVSERFKPMSYDKKFSVTPNLSIRFRDAGHILGSAMIEIWINRGEGDIKVVFSGDLGNDPSPLMKAPALIDSCDFLVVDSTCEKFKRRRGFKRFKSEFKKAMMKKRNIIIPAFSLDRTQKVIYILAECFREGLKGQKVPIYLTSKTAREITKIYKKYLRKKPEEYFDKETNELIRRGVDPLDVPGLVEGFPSDYKYPAVFVSASGMCDYASSRVLVKRFVDDPWTSIFLVGYQVPGSVGYKMRKQDYIGLGGRIYRVLARVRYFAEFSAHPDQAQIINWIKHIRGLKRIFVVHGSKDSSKKLAMRIRKILKCNVKIPKLGERYFLWE